MKTAKNTSTQILFVIPPNANMFDFSSAAQVFHEAKEHGLNLSLNYCSYENNLTSSTKVPIGKVESYKNYKVKKGDYIFIASADINYILSPKLKLDNHFINWIKEAYNEGAHICALCLGAFLLGKTDLLDGLNCTTHWKRTSEFKQMYPFAKVHENIIYIEDQRIITSAGATSGIDVALYVLSKISNEYFTSMIARELVIYNRRNGSSPQKSALLNYRNHMHAGIHKVQEWLYHNLNEKVNMPDLAEIAMMSERNFTRVFKKETQLTVNEYITLLRKEKISELIKQPDLSREQIAKQCGIQSVRHLNRLMHAN